LAALPGKRVQAGIELRYGRDIQEVLEFVIKHWHSIPEQSQALGITILEAQELYEIFCINPKKYKQLDERRFVNPFFNRKKGRPSIDGYIYRLYTVYAKLRSKHSIRPEVAELNSFLLRQANGLMEVRGLLPFSLVQSEF
jgi:hypothetical protein